MGEFAYNGEHSINFRVVGDERWLNTWSDWHMAPTTRPIVNPPTPKTEYMEVTGVDGSIDLTETLTSVKFGNRTGSWTFMIENDNWDWPVLYTKFLEMYQGKAVDIKLTDEPNYERWIYRGRISLTNFQQGQDHSSFEIAYIIQPDNYAYSQQNQNAEETSDNEEQEDETETVFTHENSDLIYNGEHDIYLSYWGPTLWESLWDYYGMAPTSRPVVNPPSPKTEYVDIPGRDGSLDFTGLLGPVKYNNRTGSWTFILDNDPTYGGWWSRYKEFKNNYHGKKCWVRLKDDPGYYYVGRITLNNYQQGSDHSSFEVGYNLEPRKHPYYEGDIPYNSDRYWEWDELFGKNAYYAKYDLFPSIHTLPVDLNVCNPYPNDTPVSINLTDGTSVTFEVWKYVWDDNEDEYTLVKEDEITLSHGDNLNLFGLKANEVKLLTFTAGYGTLLFIMTEEERF